MGAANHDRRDALKVRDLRGSRLRCLMLTTMAREQVTAVLNDLVSPIAVVTPEDHWMPEGFMRPAEPRLDNPRACPTLFHSNSRTGG